MNTNKNTLKENTYDKSSLFPLVLEELHIGCKYNMLNCHWHNEVEFIFIESGHAVFHIEDNFFDAYKDEIIIVESKKLHSAYTNTDNEECVIKSVKFNPEILSSKSSDAIQLKFINPLINNKLILPYHLTYKKDSTLYPSIHNTDRASTECAIRNYLSDLIGVLESKEENYELMAKSYLYMIFSKVLLLVKNKDDLSVEEKYEGDIKISNLKHALYYIHNNYNKAITINELANEVNLSEGHFCRMFKSLTLKTPIEYINYYRTTKAQDMLINTDKKILDICLDTGFNNLSYFINIFKKNTGYTPSKFRKEFTYVDNITR